MRINIRMIGVLFGIMVLTIIGRIVLRGGHYGRRNRGAAAVLAVGAGLLVLGWIGVFLARLIKAAVSRQRESLADASAVQFTRQSQGLANALKKIGGYTERSYLRAADPEEVSHMLFARGSRRYASLFATHPPLAARIKALDPAFREEDFPLIPAKPQVAHPDAAAQALAARAAPAGEAPADGPAWGADGRAVGDMSSDTIDDTVGDTIGNPDARQIAFARQLRRSIPEDLYAAAHGEFSAFLLTLALVLDRSGRHVERQLHRVTEQLGAERTSAVRRYYQQLMDAGPAYALPLLELAFPALKRRPAPQLRFLVDLIRRLVETDGEIDLFEYCFYQVLAANLREYGDAARSAASASGKGGAAKARQAEWQLIRIVAEKGHDDPAKRDAAWRVGAAALGLSARAVGIAIPAGADTVADLDRALAVLRQVSLSERERLVRALAVTIGHDKRVTLTEAELMRAVCAALECPLPPLITASPIASVEPRSVSEVPPAPHAPG